MELDDALKLLSRTPQAPLDVAEIALRLARDEYPNVDVEAHLGELNAMAHEARRYMNGNLNAKVTGLCRYLFHDMGFHGNVKDYYNPANSYFNMVLERRTGIPITLSALVMTVGRRAGLCVDGVGLPGHFIAKAVEGEQHVLIDPFHGGRLLSATDCENLIRQITGVVFEVSPLALEAMPTGLIVQRMLGNLKAIYMKAEDYPRALTVMQRLLQLSPREAVLRRDVGMTLARLGQFGKAVDHLRFYLDQAPEAEDKEDIESILKRVQGRLAQWN